jgi:soluble lytic murein transglycosylase-like protein
MRTRRADTVREDPFADRPARRGAAVVAALLVLWAVFLLSPPAGRTDVYRCVDEEGTIYFTNVPDRREFKLWFRESRVLLKPALGSGKYDALIAAAAFRYQVDCALIKAVIKAESNFNHRAVSPKGARGLMQLMPQTAASLKVKDSFEPEANIEGGVRYLNYLINLYEGHLPFVLAAYNAGEKAVAKHGGIPPYRETQSYVKTVLDLYDRYSAEMRLAGMTSDAKVF